MSLGAEIAGLVEPEGFQGWIRLRESGVRRNLDKEAPKVETGKRISLMAFLMLFTSSSYADIGFTKKDVETVKSACLVGSGFEFTTEADGTLSIKNLEGKGKLHINQKSVDTVDLPDADKRQEFSEIRDCIKDYLLRNNNQTKSSNGKESPSNFLITGATDDEKNAINLALKSLNVATATIDMTKSARDSSRNVNIRATYQDGTVFSDFFNTPLGNASNLIISLIDGGRAKK